MTDADIIDMAQACGFTPAHESRAIALARKVQQAERERFRKIVAMWHDSISCVSDGNVSTPENRAAQKTTLS